MQEWVIDQFLRSLDELGLERPWYWDMFVERSTTITTWSTPARTPTARRSGSTSSCRGRTSAPGCARNTRDLGASSIRSGSAITERWRERDPATTSRSTARRIVGVLRPVPARAVRRHAGDNTARVARARGRQLRLLLRAVPLDLRAGAASATPRHKDVVKRVLAGEAPANLMELVRQLLRADHETWGKDAFGGDYPWLERSAKR